MFLLAALTSAATLAWIACGAARKVWLDPWAGKTPVGGHRSPGD